MSSIGDRVKARRKELGLSQVVVAQKAGMAQGNLSDLERGRNTNTINLPALAAALQCTAEYLAHGRDGQVSEADQIAASLSEEQLTAWLEIGRLMNRRHT